MKTVGLITEYNPFHNGHLHHIRLAKEKTGADYVVVVMSGNFLQRGMPAIIDKQARTRMALSCGADLVIELPLSSACSSAEFFARGAVSLLHHAGCIDYLCFGSELGSLEPLLCISSVLAREPAAYRTALKAALKTGLSFPKARQQALLIESSALPFSKKLLEKILAEPNNILGIEYLKALLLLNSPIKPVTIPRLTTGYHDTSLDSPICSAAAIRKALKTGTPESFKNQVPLPVYEILTDALNRSFPVFTDDFSTLLHYRLLMEKDRLDIYQDVSPELASTIRRNIEQFTTVTQFTDCLKTRQYTHTRITRGLFHILLNMKQPSVDVSSENFYIRVLGFKKSSHPLLTKLKKTSQLPILTKLADAGKLLKTPASISLQKDLLATDIYNTVLTAKFGRSISSDYRRPLIIL